MEFWVLTSDTNEKGNSLFSAILKVSTIELYSGLFLWFSKDHVPATSSGNVPSIWLKWSIVL